MSERDPNCVARWPECESGAYDPRCCRFPKSCSCEVVNTPEQPDYYVPARKDPPMDTGSTSLPSDYGERTLDPPPTAPEHDAIRAWREAKVRYQRPNRDGEIIDHAGDALAAALEAAEIEKAHLTKVATEYQSALEAEVKARREAEAALRKMDDLAAHAAMQGNEESPLDLLMEAGQIARDALERR